MIVDIRQLENIKFQFTELGVALSELSDKNTSIFEDFGKSLESVGEKFRSFVSEEDLENLQGTTQAIAKYTKDLAPIFDKISSMVGTPLADLHRSLGGASESFDRIKRELDEFILPTKRKEKEITEKKEEEKDDKDGMMSSEWKTIKGEIKKGAGTLKIPLPGAMLGGLLALTVWGIKDRDRIKREVGESLNVIESAVDSGMNRATRAAASYLGNLGDQMNKFYGISKEGVQAVAKSFVDGGVKVQSMLGTVDRSMGLVGKNYVTFAMGLDKMFELASGESARRTVELMADYGKSLEGARKSWTTMLMAGKESGIGAARFVQNVTTASDSLKELGYDIDNVIDLAVGLQSAYQDMGVPRQMAGRQAALGLQQLAQGMTAMSDAWKSLVGEELGYGTGIEAKQQFDDAIQRITSRGKEEATDQEFQRTILAMVTVASRGGKEDELITREILSSEMGLGFKGAQAALAIKKAVDSGDLKKAIDLTRSNREILVNSLETEGQKQSRWQKHMNLWLQGLSKIGQGIIGLVGQGIAHLIAYFKALVPMIGNYITRDYEANDKILAAIDEFTKGSEGYKRHFAEGFKDLKDASVAAGMEAFSESLTAIQGAVNFNPFVAQERSPEGIPIGYKGATRAGATGVPSGLSLVPKFAPAIASQIPLDFGKTPKPIPLAVGEEQRRLPERVPVSPMVRTIVIPVSEPGVHQLEPLMEGGEPQFVGENFQPKEYTSQTLPMGPAKQSTLVDWVGGGISIMNKSVGGVTASGDIVLEVTGNCPRCGLIFGEDSSQMADYTHSEVPMASEEDVMTMARMLRSEVMGGRKDVRGLAKTEAVGIAFTAINRLRSGRYGSSLSDVITGGSGFGKQGVTREGLSRPYSTKREATAASLQLAKEVLSGYYNDPTGGATNFYHSTLGQGYGSRGHPELRTSMPRYTRGMINTLNVGRASFWATKKLAQQRAADAEEWQEKEEALFEKVHQQTEPVKRPEPEEWELETGMTPAY